MLQNIFKKIKKQNVDFCEEMHKLLKEAQKKKLLGIQIQNKLEIISKKYGWDFDYDKEDYESEYIGLFYVTPEEDIRGAKKVFEFEVSFVKKYNPVEFFDIKNYRIKIIRDCDTFK
jgi:hypothetical protein